MALAACALLAASVAGICDPLTPVLNPLDCLSHCRSLPA